MIKLYFLLSRKVRLLIIWIIVLGILGTAGYFIFDYTDSTLQIIKPEAKKIIEANLPVIYKSINVEEVGSNTQNVLVKEFPLETNTRKKDLTNILCLAVPTQGEYWRDFQCSILTKTWDDENAKSKVLVVNFKDVSDYFAQCSYAPLVTSNSNPKCVDATTTNYEKWLTDVVFFKAKDFVENIYRTISSGPELSLLESINIIRGVGSDETEKNNVLGKYDKGKISVYLSGANSKVDVNDDVEEAIRNINGHTSNYHRSKKGLLQTITHEYGHHHLTFNVDRSSVLEITNKLHPRNKYYVGLLESLRSSFSNATSYNEFVKMVNLLNRVITVEEREELILLIKKNIASADNSPLGNKVSSLVGTDIQTHYFTGCVDKRFQFIHNDNLYTLKTDNSKRKDEYIDQLRYWFSYDEIITRLYNLMTYVPQLEKQGTCPTLTEPKYTVLSDYLSFKTLGLDPFKSAEASKAIMNKLSPVFSWYDVASDILRSDLALNAAIFKNHNNIDYIDNNVIPGSSGFQNPFFITGNTQTTLGWVRTATFGESPYALGFSSLDRGPRVSKYDWNNTFYKTSFLGTDIINIATNNNMQAFTSHYTTKAIQAQDMNNKNPFLFEDSQKPNIYIGGDTRIELGFIGDITNQ